MHSETTPRSEPTTGQASPRRPDASGEATARRPDPPGGATARRPVASGGRRRDGRRVRRSDPAHEPTTDELLWEIIDLSGGLAVVLLPLFITAVPFAVLFILAPAILLALAAAPFALAAALLVFPYLLFRRLARRRSTGRRQGSGASRPAGASRTPITRPVIYR